MKYARKVLLWAFIATAATPAIYADATLTPAQNIKTLFLRLCITLTSLLFAYLMVFQKEFRSEMAERARVLWKHPIVKTVVCLYVILLVSTIFSYHQVAAFLGEPEREEGLLGLTFFYGVFLFGAFLLKKKDWYSYFGVLMAAQVPVFFSALLQVSQGLDRTNSILGNPIYFAVYALCMLCISAIMWLRAKRENWGFVKFASVVSMIIAAIDLFLGNTRAVLLGAAVAFPVAVIYAAIRAKDLFPKADPKKVRRSIGIIFAVAAIFAGTFLATRHDAVWSHIPGIDRVAASSSDDATTQSRLISWSIAVHSINPAAVSPMRSLFGWGWDNYFFAWQEFYQPKLYQYDTATFDHPHNKLLDMLVMNGFTGLIAYLILWFFFVRAVLRYGKREPGIALVLIFWSVAYFVQNLFAFDSIVSWIIWFAIFAFIASETLDDGQGKASSKSAMPALTCAFPILALCFLFAFVWWTAIPYVQMSEWRSGMDAVLAGDDSQFPNDPFIYADYNTYDEGNMAINSFSDIFNQYVHGTRTTYTPLYDIALTRMKDWVLAHPYRYDHFLFLAKGYELEANLTGNTSLYATADTYYQMAIALCPDRQDLLYAYAEHLSNTGQKEEAVALMQKMWAENPNIPQTEYYLGIVLAAGDKTDYDSALQHLENAFNSGMVAGDPIAVKSVYEHFFVYYYDNGDVPRFTLAVARLLNVDPTQKDAYTTILDYVKANHSIPALNITQ